MSQELMELFDLVETCPDCGVETGFGPCGCAFDAPQRALDVSRTKAFTGSMREMVQRKLARKARKATA